MTTWIHSMMRFEEPRARRTKEEQSMRERFRDAGVHTRQGAYDDVIKWKHFPSYWPYVRGIHRSSVNSPHNGQEHGALMYSLILTGALWGESISQRWWIHHTKSQRCFDIAYCPDQSVEQTVQLLVIWAAITLMLRQCTLYRRQFMCILIIFFDII